MSGPTSVASSDGSPEDDLGGELHKLPQKSLEDATLNKDALHADARLAGITESRMRSAEGGFIKIEPVVRGR